MPSPIEFPDVIETARGDFQLWENSSMVRGDRAAVLDFNEVLNRQDGSWTVSMTLLAEQPHETDRSDKTATIRVEATVNGRHHRQEKMAKLETATQRFNFPPTDEQFADYQAYFTGIAQMAVAVACASQTKGSEG